MTNREVWITIMSEVTGQPKAAVAANVEAMFRTFPDTDRSWWDQPAPPNMLDQLRQEKPAIMNWLLEGRRKVVSGQSQFLNPDGTPRR